MRATHWLTALLLLLPLTVDAGQVTFCSSAAERMRGLVWCDDFRSQSRTEDNGGTVTGAPTFSPSQGVTLDGATDYLQYNLTGREFDSDPISIVVEFTPDFDYDEGVSRYLFQAGDGAGNHDYRMHHGSGSNNFQDRLRQDPASE